MSIVQTQQLAKFLDTAEQKGYATSSVIKQTRTALQKISRVIADDPGLASRDLNDGEFIGEILTRFMTKFPDDLSTESANVYKSRLIKAADNCQRYFGDPLAYRSTFAQNGNGAGSGAKKTRAPKPSAKSQTNAKSNPNVAAETLRNGSPDTFETVFPLRKDFLMRLCLPRDLSTAEVKRLAHNLLTLCSDYDTNSAKVFYQGPSAGNSESPLLSEGVGIN